MLRFICVVCLFLVINAHNSNVEVEGDIQSSLIPQELNTAFVPGQDTPWKAILPISRVRRNTEISPSESQATIAEHVKRYSRVVACVVLAASAIIEILIYLVEYYTNGNSAQ